MPNKKPRTRKRVTPTPADLDIDDELARMVPPLTEEERRTLMANVTADGRFTDPITVWRDPDKPRSLTIIDGHNRWAIWQDPDLPDNVRAPVVEEVALATRAEVVDWILEHQLGRRNLDRNATAILRGRLVQRVAETTRTGRPKKGTAPTGSAVEQVADRSGASPSAVKRDVQYVEALDVLRDDDPDLAERIESGAVKVARTRVVAAAQEGTKRQRVRAVKEAAANNGKPSPALATPDAILKRLERSMGALTRDVDALADALGVRVNVGRHKRLLDMTRALHQEIVAFHDGAADKSA